MNDKHYGGYPPSPVNINEYLNECADVSRHLEVNDYNLDLIYEGIENGSIV